MKRLLTSPFKRRKLYDIGKTVKLKVKRGKR